MKNKSNLSFEAGFAGIYINDKKTAKRTSVQQIIITPVYADPLPCIADSTGMQWVIAIPKTTIPDKKQMSLEVLEKNGGRHINIIIRNKDLFKAKAI